MKKGKEKKKKKKKKSEKKHPLTLNEKNKRNHHPQDCQKRLEIPRDDSRKEKKRIRNKV
jgi:hypothetical protein